MVQDTFISLHGLVIVRPWRASIQGVMGYCVKGRVWGGQGLVDTLPSVSWAFIRRLHFIDKTRVSKK